VKLRNELHHVIRLHLYERLHGTLHRAGVDSATIARPITKRLQEEFFALVGGKKPDRHNWLTPVSAPVTAVR